MPLLSLLKRNILLLVVFLTGAAVLIIEVAATRILSPYFGNTIFTVSSVISVILLALSIGYSVGGKIADKKGSESLFYYLILAGGVSVLALHSLSSFILPYVNAFFSLKEGPLVASILLFFLPGVLLGMLSPLVVTLQKKRAKTGVGEAAGNVFFWSTLGSITGSLGTGFVLIPQFGINVIMFSVGIFLSLLGIAGLAMSKNFSNARKELIGIFIFFAIANGIFISITEANAKDTYVYYGDGLYDSIAIYDGTYRGHPTRFLRQSTDASSAIHLNSDDLAFEYTNYYALHKLTSADLKRALIIGGGAYSVPNRLVREDADVIVDVAEIEPDLYQLSKQYFGVTDDPRLQNHVEDGRRFLQNSEGEYDLIFVDAFHTSIPSHLMTKEFYELSREKLSDNGIFVMNIIGPLDDAQPTFTWSAINTVQSAFPNHYFFAVDTPESTRVQNIMLVGRKSDLPLSFTTNDAFLRTVSDHVITIPDNAFDGQLIFTDDYAPVEYLISQRFKR